MTSLRILLALSLFAAACVPEETGGYDLDVDPDDLEDHGKADGEACANHPGGPLDGDDLLVLLNKEPDQQLSREWAPDDLVYIDSTLMMPGRRGQVRQEALTALEEMLAAAREEAVLALGVRSAYRSYETQCYTFNYWVDVKGLEHAKQYSAEPGRSQHQLGTTVDITSAALDWKLEPWIADSDEARWLEANSLRFGYALGYPPGAEDLTGYGYEPWHFRYIGRAAAAELAGTELILEEYLRFCQDGGLELACPRAEPAPDEEPEPGSGSEPDGDTP